MEKPTIRLLVSDIDGTLLNDDGSISERNRAAIRKLDYYNIGFTLATGRMDRMIRLFVQQLDIRLPVIACNGAVIRDCRDDRIMWRKDLQSQDARGLIQWLGDSGYDFMCYSPDDVIYPAHSRRIRLFDRYNQLASSHGLPTIPLIPLESRDPWEVAAGLIKILAVPDGETSLAALKRQVAKRPSLAGTASMSDAFDIQAAGVSKGDALTRLAVLLGLDLGQVAAVGDNDNDVEMLKTAGLGIAMANATPAAREAGQIVIPLDNNQSGLAEAIDAII